jgi:hypothetical protein
MNTQPPIQPKLPLIRRTFSIDGVNGGHVDVCETTDFDYITLRIHTPNQTSVEIQLDSDHFSELSHLKYVLQMANYSPF